MNLHDLERHGQPLLQQEANLIYQRGQAKERLAEIEEELAKVQGKIELLRVLAEELSGDSAAPAGGHPSAIRRQRSDNGVVIPDPEPEEEEA